MNEPEIDKETQERLDHISELAKELEQALVEVMLPSTLKLAPGPAEIEDKVIKFFNHCVNNVMFIATKRVVELWPEMVAKDHKRLATLLDALEDLIQAKPDPTPLDKKLN